MSSRDANIARPAFPGAPDRYDKGNEQAFRQAVEHSFQSRPPPRRWPLYVSHHGFRAAQVVGPVDWSSSTYNLTLGTLGELEDFYAPLILPFGAKVTDLTFRGYSGAVGNTCECSLIRVDGPTTSVDVETVSITSETVVTSTASLSAPEPITDTSHYLLHVYLNFAAAGTAPSFFFVRVDYVF